MNIPAVESRLAILEASGDFADEIILHEGNWLGVIHLLSFDKLAINLLKKNGKFLI